MRDRDIFCGNCGNRHAAAAPPPPPYPPPPPSPPPPPRSGFAPHPPAADPLAGLSPRAASIICYIPTVGWIASVVLLSSSKFRNDLTVRFHAFQGLYLFAIFLLNQWVLHPLFANAEHVFHFDRLLSGLLLGVAIFMMVKSSHGEAYVLPIIGELAQRSAHER